MTTSTLKPEPKRRTTAAQPESPDFAEVINLLAVFSEAKTRLAELEAGANAALLELIDEHKADYAQLQETATKAETALEVLCRRHPEWFRDAKSLKTPYGKVAFRSGSSLVVKDDEATVNLLRAEEARTHARREAGHPEEIFKAADFIRTVELPNLEALEKLDDATLKKFMVSRVNGDVFSATAAKVDFGQAVKEAAKSTH